MASTLLHQPTQCFFSNTQLKGLSHGFLWRPPSSSFASSHAENRARPIRASVDAPPFPLFQPPKQEESASEVFVFEDPMSKWKQTQKIKLGELKKNEMDRYLEDEVAEDYDGFDILRWWKGKTLRYRVLSCMARDILAIPVSTVASESVFSTGGRIIDPYRSALSPITVEALVCTQNWLKPAKIVIPLEEGDQAVDQAVSSACSGVTTVGESEVQSSMPLPQSS